MDKLLNLNYPSQHSVITITYGGIFKLNNKDVHFSDFRQIAQKTKKWPFLS